MQTIAAFKNAGEEKILSLLPLAWHPLAGGGEISPAIQSKNPHIQAESEGGRGCALWSLSVFHSYCRIQQADNVMVAWECLLGGVWFVGKCLGCCHIPGFLCTSFPCFPPSFLLCLQVMGADLIPEKLKEEFQGEVKCIGSSALASLVTASASEFETKWFGELRDDLCHSDRQLCQDSHIPPLAT